MLRSSMRPIRVGEGGAPPVQTRTLRGRRRADGSFASMIRTVGAALKWVTASCSSHRQTSAGSTRGRQMLRAPAAATAQVWLHPLQWNIGSVQRTQESAVRWFSATMARAFRYAPRWWYMTPLGWPVVPDV